MSDPRVHEFKCEFIAHYEFKYKIKPKYDGKHAKHNAEMWKRVDKNNLHPVEIYLLLNWFFESNDLFILKTKHDFVFFCNNMEKLYLAFREPKKAVIKQTVVNMDETLKVIPQGLDGLKKAIYERYKEPLSFIQMLKFQAKTEAVKNKAGRIYEDYQKQWAIGYEIWGKETLLSLWTSKDA